LAHELSRITGKAGKAEPKPAEPSHGNTSGIDGKRAARRGHLGDETNWKASVDDAGLITGSIN